MEDTMFSTRTVPWMKIGAIEDGAKTAREAAELGGLDFQVSKTPAGWVSQDGQWHTIPHRYAVVREDTGDAFEVVGPTYSILQYNQAFDFMDQVGGEYVAAGALRGGRQGFMVVDPGIRVSPAGDRTDLYVVLRTSHDRSRAVEVSVMPLRNMCMNQLTLSSFANGAKFRWSVPHVSTMEAKLDQATSVLAGLTRYGQEFERVAEKLMCTHLTASRSRTILDRTIQGGGEKRDEIIDDILRAWQENETTVGFTGTGWALVNSVSEFMDWHKIRRQPESRFIQALQGSTHKTINRVMEMALAA